MTRHLLVYAIHIFGIPFTRKLHETISYDDSWSGRGFWSDVLPN